MLIIHTICFPAIVWTKLRWSPLDLLATFVALSIGPRCGPAGNRPFGSAGALQGKSDWQCELTGQDCREGEAPAEPPRDIPRSVVPAGWGVDVVRTDDEFATADATGPGCGTAEENRPSGSAGASPSQMLRHMVCVLGYAFSAEIRSCSLWVPMAWARSHFSHSPAYSSAVTLNPRICTRTSAPIERKPTLPAVGMGSGISSLSMNPPASLPSTAICKSLSCLTMAT